MRDVKLIDYLPPVLQDIAEFTAIMKSVQPEINTAWDALNFIMDNQFIDTATEAGVSIWEKESGIVPLAADSLADRKQRLKTAWSKGVVYTVKWLSELLTTYNKNATDKLNILDYTLKAPLTISDDWRSLCDLLRIRLPENIAISPVLILPESVYTHTVGSAVRLSIKRTIVSNSLQKG